MSKDENSTNPTRRGFLRAAGAAGVALSPFGKLLASSDAFTNATPAALDAATALSPALEQKLGAYVKGIYHYYDEWAKVSDRTAWILNQLEAGNVVELGELPTREHLVAAARQLQPLLESVVDSGITEETMLDFVQSNRFKALTNNLYVDFSHDLATEADFLFDKMNLPASAIPEEISYYEYQMTTQLWQLENAAIQYNFAFRPQKAVQSTSTQPAAAQQINALQLSGPETNLPAFGTRYREHASPIPYNYYTGQQANSWHERIVEQTQAATSVKTQTR